MKVKMRIEGTKELTRKLRAFGKDGEIRMSDVAFKSAQRMRSEAEASRRTYSETIQQFIGDIKFFPNVEGANAYEVFVSNVPMSAYVEFGTGAKVKIPDGWHDVAQEFFVNGEGTLPPFPYFIPAFNKVKATYQTDLKDELNRLVKQYNGSTR